MLRFGSLSFARHFSRMVKPKVAPTAPDLSEKHAESDRMDPLDPSIDPAFLAEMHLGKDFNRYLEFTFINLKEMPICVF